MTKWIWAAAGAKKKNEKKLNGEGLKRRLAGGSYLFANDF